MAEPRERVRVNAKQTAKNLWQIEATFEDEAANVDTQGVGARLLEAVKSAESEWRADGRSLVSDL